MLLIHPLFASDRPWPDLVDVSAILIFFGGILLTLLFSYLVMVLDFRAYLRALQGMLVRVTYHFPDIPKWARYETPACLNALGLRLPCTTEDIKTAYRKKAEQLHPDRGGDRRKFMRLQAHFENAIQFVADVEKETKAEAAG